MQVGPLKEQESMLRFSLVMNALNLLPQKIKEVIYLNDKYRDTENNRIARKIFDLAGINYRKLVPEEEVLNSLGDHFQKLSHEA